MTTTADRGREPSLPGRAAQPQRYKMAVINWLAAYPLITLLLSVGAPLIQRVPIFVTTLVLSVTLVCLMTFVVMPMMTRLFAGWLRGTR
ncbi:hypothetical protein ACO229_11155 [Promicromonospora sp. MS192]|uniref:hypothetical protein n=1 Tax=Promicromonospora sp. MS192 TaxID=3412684 RepID=UPI003C2F4E3E